MWFFLVTVTCGPSLIPKPNRGSIEQLYNFKPRLSNRGRRDQPVWGRPLNLRQQTSYADRSSKLRAAELWQTSLTNPKISPKSS